MNLRTGTVMSLACTGWPMRPMRWNVVSIPRSRHRGDDPADAPAPLSSQADEQVKRDLLRRLRQFGVEGAS